MEANTEQFTIDTSNVPRGGGENYEDAMRALQNLQSNAELIAQAGRKEKRNRANKIPNMIKYITRSGLTMEDVDKLSVIHVSGTKGKGSTCAFCERILHARGYKTGLFTSPHMIEVRERIQINGRPISQDLFCKYFWRVYDSLETTQTQIGVGADNGGGMPPYFAFLTVLSLHVFLSEGVDVAVVEVGIGGQFDSTNFFRRPVVCGVTSLGLDHTATLGNTVPDIAWSKAGIFKPGRPAVTVSHERTVMEVLLKRAHEIQIPLYLAAEMSRECMERQNIQLGIAGVKQVENASLAIQLCNIWEQNHTSGRPMVHHPPTSAGSVEEIPQLDISDVDEATAQGLSSCVWPGRAQTLCRGDVTYYLDGAHTKESMEVCVQWFKETAEKDRRLYSWKKCARILLFNATGNRDVALLLACLAACNFDAALFCTNMLSIVESHNKLDQINKTVTVSHMIEKADVNKSTWDELITRSRQPSEITEGCPSFNGGIHPGTSASRTDPHNHQVITDTSTSSKDLVCLDHNWNQAPVSMKFPCILHALVWATQGKDPLVSARETEFAATCIPDVLQKADHVQILVTGSLHLVGGVLGVVDPHMND